MEGCFIDCRTNEQTTYESIDPSSTPSADYTRIHYHTPEHDAENTDAAVPVTGDYLTPTETGDISTAQTSSPATSAYVSIFARDPTDDTADTSPQIPGHDYEEAP